MQHELVSCFNSVCKHVFSSAAHVRMAFFHRNLSFQRNPTAIIKTRRRTPYYCGFLRSRVLEENSWKLLGSLNLYVEDILMLSTCEIPPRVFCRKVVAIFFTFSLLKLVGTLGDDSLCFFYSMVFSVMNVTCYVVKPAILKSIDASKALH